MRSSLPYREFCQALLLLLCSPCIGQEYAIEELEQVKMRICLGSLVMFEDLMAAPDLTTAEVRLISLQRVHRQVHERNMKEALPVLKDELEKLHAHNVEDVRHTLLEKSMDLRTIRTALRDGQWCPTSGCWDAPNAAVVTALLGNKGIGIDQVVGVRAVRESARYFVLYYDAPGEPDGVKEPGALPPTSVDAQSRMFQKNKEAASQELKRRWSRLASIVQHRLGIKLTDSDLRSALKAIQAARLVPAGEWPALVERFPGNSDATSRPAFAAPDGRIFVKHEAGNQALTETMERLITHEGIHIALSPHGTTEEQDHEVIDELFR